MGPKKTLFLDEISTGLDSSTTFQITRTLRDFSHLRKATMLVALLQPTPETYNLFDDILLMSEGACDAQQHPPAAALLQIHVTNAQVCCLGLCSSLVLSLCRAMVSVAAKLSQGIPGCVFARGSRRAHLLA